MHQNLTKCGPTHLKLRVNHGFIPRWLVDNTLNVDDGFTIATMPSELMYSSFWNVLAGDGKARFDQSMNTVSRSNFANDLEECGSE